MKLIYIICQYNGYEGHGAPLQAIEDSATAEALVRAMQAGAFSTTFRLYAVPVWPDADGQTYREPVPAWDQK